MKRMIIGIFAASVMSFYGCSPEDRAEMEGEKLDQFELTSSERSIAEALVQGYKKDTGMALLRSQDYGRAACYAKTVKMPGRYERAHLLYLMNYPEADKDFYGFFSKYNVGEQTSYDMSQIFKKAYDQCSNSALIKRFMKKSDK